MRKERNTERNNNKKVDTDVRIEKGKRHQEEGQTGRGREVN